MELILAEQLLLLLLDDDKGSDKSSWGRDPGLSGAVLLDLTRERAVEEADGKLVAISGAAPAHPVLADAHTAIAKSEKARNARGWVGRLPRDLKPLAERIADRLIERGVLTEQRHKLLGLFKTTRYPQVDPGPERELRDRLCGILLGERQPTEQDAMLVALLIPYDQVKPLVPSERRKEAKARAKSVAEGGGAGKAVDDTIKGIQTAVMVSMTLAIAAAAGAS